MKLKQPVSAYEQSTEVTVKRLKHRINFHQGEGFADFLASLKEIHPRGIIEIDDFGCYGEPDSLWGWIEFHEEVVV